MWVVPHLMVGGAERHASTLLASMDPERFRGSMVCLQDRGRVGSGPNWARLEAADVHRVELGRARRDYPGMLAGLVREMRRERPDVVVVRGFTAELLGRAAAILTGVPTILFWVRNSGDVTPPGPARRRLNRLLAAATDEVYGVAHGQLPYVTGDLGYDADQLRVIYNGIDPTWVGTDTAAALADGTARRDDALARELGIGDDETAIGIVAVLRPEKDHATLLRAFARAVAQRPDLKLVLVGDGPQRARLEALVGELGLGDRVLFLGHRDDARRLLRAFDLFTLTSRTVEACPNSLLEAMSAGLPAVCTAVGGVPEMIDDGVTGRVVPAEDPDALAAALLAVLADPDAAREMGRAGRRRVLAEFTLERSLAEAQNALEETVGRRPVPGSTPLRVTLVMDLAAHGGAETVIRDTFAHLDPAHVVADLVCLREEGPLAPDFRASGVGVTTLRRRRLGRYDPSVLLRLVEHLRRRRTDVVLVSHHHRAALDLGRVAALLVPGCTSVVAAHNMDRVALGGRVLPRHVVETLCLSRGLALLSPSQGRYLRDQEGVAASWRSRTREFDVPNGIPMPQAPTPAERAEVRAEIGATDVDVVIAIVARLTGAKAHHVLFEAVERARRAGTAGTAGTVGLRVLVVGDGPRRAELEADVAARGLTGAVTFLGQRRDALRLLAGCNVFALSSAHEGVPISIMEAMARGLPVVSTRVGAVHDLVTDGDEGFLVDRGDVAALADRLTTLAGDPALRATMGERARRRAVRDFAIEGTAAAFTSMVEAVAPRRRAGRRLGLRARLRSLRRRAR